MRMLVVASLMVHACTLSFESHAVQVATAFVMHLLWHIRHGVAHGCDLRHDPPADAVVERAS